MELNAVKVDQYHAVMSIGIDVESISNSNEDVVEGKSDDDDELLRSYFYTLHSTSAKSRIVIVGGFISLLTPFTDTIYLPALSNVATSLHASPAQVAATVSSYLGAVGVGQLVWGILSDRFGRLPILYSTLLAYEAFTIGCIFADSIDTLLAMRTLEGFIVGSSIICIQGTISDIFEPSERGDAMGKIFVPLLVGPIIAPVIGGALSFAYGWRSTFILLAFLTIPIFVSSLVVIPETNRHIVKERLYAAEVHHDDICSTMCDAQYNKHVSTDALQRIKDHPKVCVPPLQTPYQTLLLLVEPNLVAFYAGTSFHFACMFTSLTILPLYLSLPPYGLSEAVIGLTYLPIGAGMLIGALVGGKLSDISDATYPSLMAGRMLYPTLGNWICSFGVLSFGYTLGRSAPLYAVLITHFILGFGQAMLMPSSMSYLSVYNPNIAAAACGGLTFLCFVLSAVSISISIEVIDSIGIENFFLILFIGCIVLSVWPSYFTMTVRKIAFTRK